MPGGNLAFELPDLPTVAKKSVQANVGPIDTYLSIACQHFDVLGKAIKHHGNRTLTEYLDAIQPQPGPSHQSREDLFDILYANIEPYFGDRTARQTIADLERTPLVLTANHHGVTYFAQDFQGSLIFALNRMGQNTGPRTVPVFACGTVPLDNLTFPLGLLCYHTNANGPHSSPKKIAVFSNKMRRQMVSCAKPFDLAMIARARKRAKKMISEEALSATLDEALSILLDEEYSRSQVTTLPRYTQQSLVLNHRIWKRIFEGHRQAPELITLELEKVAIGLLIKDLENSDSLAHNVMFDSRLRDNVLKALDGGRACWQTKHLLRRLHADTRAPKGSESAAGCGTMLFWGLNERGRQIPLYLRRTASGKEALCGVDDRGKVHEKPYTAASIIDGLLKEQLLPSIFTSLLTLSLARGVVCAGGYFQCDYLPAMQQGLVSALEQTGGYDEVARRVAGIKTNTYLSGMIAVMRRIEGDHLVPAGPVEIIAGGGLDDGAIFQMQALTLKNAHIGALAETIQDLPPSGKASLTPNWRSELAIDAARVIHNKVAVV
jgi:hypothetical protein